MHAKFCAKQAFSAQQVFQHVTLACCGCLVMSSSCLGASQARLPAAALLLAVLALAAAMSASLQ
jgi:hypothetical protein